MKKILVILLVLLMTGCSVEYKLDFHNDELREDFNVVLKGNSYNKSQINQLYKTQAYAIYDGLGQEKYDVNYNDSGIIFKANYNHIYNLKDYNRSTVINQCYDAAAFTSDDDKYILMTSKEFLCMAYEEVQIDGVVISITTNHKVLENNADVVNKNTYKWNITEENYKNKPIKIVFSKKSKKNLWDILKDMNVLYVFLIGIALIGGIGFLIIYLINKKNNRI